jgi:hypothetical protein
MKAAFQIVFWEILWKNRVVFPALVFLLLLGAGLARAATLAPADAWWLAEARSLTLMAFLISALLGFAPFILMESSGGWRMNSMITRWFTLPLPTVHLVFLPLLVASLFLALLVAAWVPVLNAIAPGFDGPYFTGVLIVALVAINALAWTVPRKPGQFWVGVGFLFPVVLILAVMPQDHAGTDSVPRGIFIPLSAVSLVLLALTWLAARRNRCGDWPGELPLDRVWGFLRQGRAASGDGGDFRSPVTALFRLDVLPSVRLLGLSWLALLAGLFVYISLTLRASQRDLAFSLRLLALVGVSMVPGLGLLWMAVWGLFVGGEPSAGFRTRLTSFRSTLPVSCGLLAGQRILTLLLGWVLVWAPLLALSFLYDPESVGIPSSETPAAMQTMLARLMAMGAYLVVGALPLFLWGRFEGFPNFLLAGVCTWAWLWLVGASLSPLPGQSPGWLWLPLTVLLAFKLGLAVWGLTWALRSGHTTWRFPLFLSLGWGVLTGLLVLALSTLKLGGVWSSLMIVLLVPFARLAWCPLAIAANRHR